MKRFCFFMVAVVTLFASCWTFYKIPEYTNYSETIDIPGMDAAVIYMKTAAWAQEWAQRYYFSPTLSEREIYVVGPNWIWNFSFHIENEQCQLTFSLRSDRQDGNLFYDTTKKGAREQAIELMDWHKNIASEYWAFITTPALSQEEIDELIAKGDEAFENEKFSEAEKYYLQVITGAPPNVDIADVYVSCGLAIEFQYPDTNNIEMFVIDTNHIMSVFNKNTDPNIIFMDRYSYEWGVYLYHSDEGYDAECKRLERAYEADNTKNFDRAVTMYNAALSIDPNNEIASQRVGYIKQRNAYINSRYSQLKTALNNIKQSYVPERERRMAQNQAESFAKLLDNANRFAQSVEQVQRNQSGGNTGTYSGGGSSSGQGGGRESGGSSARDSGSSSSRGDINVAAMQRTYNSRSKAVERHYDNYQKDPSSSNRQAFLSAQRSLRDYRLECNKKGADITAGYWENKSL